MKFLSSAFVPPTAFPHSEAALLCRRPAIQSPRWARRVSVSAAFGVEKEKKEKVVVVLGATGSGKSRMSVDLATRFFTSAEVINSDKIQVYRGLDVTTNKMTMPDRRGVRHHLLGEFDPSESHPEFTPSDFRSVAGDRISDIISRGKTPFVVGGSNSFVYSLLAKRFDPKVDVFGGSDPVDPELRYDCCFLWVDVSPPVLNEYLFKRVDEMMGSGMLEELARWFSDPGNPLTRTGLAKAIGVPEFARYFRYSGDCDETRRRLYAEAVREIKENTRVLAERQQWKIQRLRERCGWDLQRINTTAAFAAAMGPESKSETAEIWEKQVVQPSMKIVEKFLLEEKKKSLVVEKHGGGGSHRCLHQWSTNFEGVLAFQAKNF
ncbi:unnamed protein product [Cuscuta epithymum]|uniref:Adenylate isopentenyltransferase n=1 Tax=Cuscuta epithymum TaxID=186058 RepID=A0AAV0DLM2_9ASTE|nr:unnamed protein product [Cuscuta epithymum]